MTEKTDTQWAREIWTWTEYATLCLQWGRPEDALKSLARGRRALRAWRWDALCRQGSAGAVGQAIAGEVRHAAALLETGRAEQAAEMLEEAESDLQSFSDLAEGADITALRHAINRRAHQDRRPPPFPGG